jgi:hypothetical protein
MEPGTIAALGLTVLGLILGLFQWSLTGNYKRQAEIGKARDAKIDQLDQELRAINLQLQTFKEEVHREYARNGSLKDLAEEIRDDMGKLFDKFDLVSGQLNQLIGERRNNNG